MKAILIVCFSLFLFSASYSQEVVEVIKSGAAIVNAGTSETILKVGKVHYLSMSVHPVITKVSGTVAGNSVLLASNDGINYVSMADSTLSHGNVTTNTLLWEKANVRYSYYKVLSTGSGTMNATPRIIFRLVKPAQPK